MWKIMKSKLIFLLMAAMVLFAANTGWAKMTGFSATGVLLEIDEGDVSPAGNSGRFIVKDRQITGELTLISDGSEEGIDYSFTLTYGSNVSSDQSGQAHGTIEIGIPNEYEAKFRAEISPDYEIGECIPSFEDLNCIETIVELPTGDLITVFVKMFLNINGSMTFTDGTQGRGSLYAKVIPKLVVIPPDFETLHIGGISEGSWLEIDGKWKE